MAALRRAVQQYAAYGQGELQVMARDALILNFEICYGQCGAALKRCLQDVDGMDGAALEVMSLATLIRTANERGYLKATWPEWKAFRDARNIAAHAYSEPAAEKIARAVPEFLLAAEFMLERMQQKAETA